MTFQIQHLFNSHWIISLYQKLRYNVQRFFKPYNVLKLPIENSYHEVDDLFFYSIKTIFLDYIELEKPFLSWDSERTNERFTDVDKMQSYIDKYETLEVDQKILDLYKWFKIEQPKLLEKNRMTTLNSISTDSFYYYLESKKLYELETQKLKELIDLRNHLWT